MSHIHLTNHHVCPADGVYASSTSYLAAESSEHQDLVEDEEQQQQEENEIRYTSTPLKMPALHQVSALKSKNKTTSAVTMPFFGTSSEPEELTEDSWYRGPSSNHTGSPSSSTNQVKTCFTLCPNFGMFRFFLKRARLNKDLFKYCNKTLNPGIFMPHFL